MRALALAAALLSVAAAGQSIPRDDEDAQGRVGLSGGWRYTPNAAFATRAAAAGLTTQPSPGGPWLVATFAYGPFRWLEVGIDLFASGERLRVDGYSPFTTITYGGLLGARLRTSLGRFLADEWVPSLGVFGGPTLVHVSGGPSSAKLEALSTGWVASAALNARFDKLWLGLEARYLLGAHGLAALSPTGGAQVPVDGGGLWVGLCVSWTVAPDGPKDRLGI